MFADTNTNKMSDWEVVKEKKSNRVRELVTSLTQHITAQEED